ncbi:DUF1569 domain-containing protein [Rhodocaloribacter sp.]
MTKQSLYDPDVYRRTLARIDALTPESRPRWGTMNAAQMPAHCAEIIEVANGKPLENTPLIARLFKGMIRKMVVGERPYPKSTRTHPQYRQTSDRDFETEKQRLLDALEQFKETEGERIPHPLFGEMSAAEKGWAMYKHLDHHLTQFGV